MYLPIRILRRRIALVSILLLVIGIIPAAAQQYVQPDGRINQLAHFGGDAWYCIAENFNPINLPGTYGFRLLNSDGQVLWDVPKAEVLAALDQVEMSGLPVLVATGNGSYGEFSLYAFASEAGISFLLTGYDEHGKQNAMIFHGCTPVGGLIEASEGEEAPELLTCTVTSNQDVTSTYLVTTFEPDGTQYFAIDSDYAYFLTNPAEFYLFFNMQLGWWVQWDGDFNGGSVVTTTCSLPEPIT